MRVRVVFQSFAQTTRLLGNIGAGALPVVNAFVSQIRSGGTVQKAIAEAGLRSARIP